MHNMQMLWNYPDAAFIVDKNGELHTSRLESFKEKLHINSKKHPEVVRVVIETLTQVNEELQRGHKIYVTNDGHDVRGDFLGAAKLYSPKFPAYCVAKKILGKFPEAEEIIQTLISKEELFPLSKSQGGVFRGMDDPRVLDFGETPSE